MSNVKEWVEKNYPTTNPDGIIGLAEAVTELRIASIEAYTHAYPPLLVSQELENEFEITLQTLIYEGYPKLANKLSDLMQQAKEHQLATAFEIVEKYRDTIGGIDGSGDTFYGWKRIAEERGDIK